MKLKEFKVVFSTVFYGSASKEPQWYPADKELTVVSEFQRDAIVLAIMQLQLKEGELIHKIHCSPGVDWEK